MFLFNFPKGKIFTGDGGAYLIGFILATFSILLVKRNIEVSPWVPILIVILPIFETIFSMYRRKMFQSMALSQPDALHLHSLIYRRVTPHIKFVKSKIYRNAATAVIMWFVIFIPIIPAIFFWDQTGIILISIVLFMFFYTWLYFRIVRFRTPKMRKKVK